MASRALPVQWRFDRQDTADHVRDDRGSRAVLVYKLETD